MEDKKKKYSNPNFKLSFSNVQDNHPKYATADLTICHDGWNRNGSHMSTELIEQTAEESLGGTPIVGFVEKEEDGNRDFAGHEEEYKVTVNQDGTIEEEMVYLGSPFGFVPFGVDWNIVEKEVEGTNKNYLEAYDVIIWKKFEGGKVFLENPNKFHSMELLPSHTDYKWVDDLKGKSGYDFTEMMFDAFCILGDKVPPAMAGANLSQFSKNEKENGSLKKAMMEYSELNKDSKVKGGGVMPKGTKFASSEYMQSLLKDELKSVIQGWVWIVDHTDQYVAYENNENIMIAEYSVSGEEGNEEVDINMNDAVEGMHRIASKDGEIIFESLMNVGEMNKNFESIINEKDDKLKNFEAKDEKLNEKIEKFESDIEKLNEDNEDLKEKLNEYQLKEKESLLDETDLPDAIMNELSDNIENFSIDELKEEIEVAQEKVKMFEDYFKSKGKFSLDNDNDDDNANADDDVEIDDDVKTMKNKQKDLDFSKVKGDDDTDDLTKAIRKFK